MKEGHEITFIHCECGYEGEPSYHDHWLWNQNHPVQGPVTKRQHEHAEMLQRIGPLIQAAYEPRLREQLEMDVVALRRTKED